MAQANEHCQHIAESQAIVGRCKLSAKQGTILLRANRCRDGKDVRISNLNPYVERRQLANYLD